MSLVDRSVYYSSRLHVKDDTAADPDLAAGTVQLRTLKLLRTRTGGENPRYKQLIADKQNATTQLDGTFDSLEAHRSSARMTYKYFALGGDYVFTKEAWGDLASNLASYSDIPNVGFNGSAEARASANFLAKVKSANQSMTGGVFLGEMRETLRMLRKPAAGLRDGIDRHLKMIEARNRDNRNRYHRKQPRKYARNLTAIASQTWLENAFGWVPLLHDIEDARKAYNKLFDVDRVVKVSVGGQESQLGSSGTYSDTIGALPLLYHLVNEILTGTYTVRYRGAVVAQAGSTSAARLQQFGFTPSEFIPTAWELLPWSFLVDYFANIGDLLNAATTDTSAVTWVNKSVVTNCVRVQRIQLDIARLKAQYSPPGFEIQSIHGTPGFAIRKRRVVNRSVGNINATYPALNLTYPGFDTSPKKWLNISALMAQVGLTTHPQRMSNRNYRL
jgi:hypothetical protein